MIRQFKFFNGFTNGDFVLYSNGNRAMTISWDGVTTLNTNAEDDLVRILSEEMSRVIDDEIVDRLTRQINSGFNPQFEGPIIGFNNNVA